MGRERRDHQRHQQHHAFPQRLRYEGTSRRDPHAVLPGHREYLIHQQRGGIFAAPLCYLKQRESPHNVGQDRKEGIQ